MLTKKQIIDDTAKYFNVNNRATNDGGCSYIDSNGNKCAIGRYLKDELNKFEYFNDIIEEYFDKPVICFSGDGDIFLDEVIKPEYTGHEYKFWRDLQEFHDNNSFWNETGMTGYGMSYYNHLLKKWADE
jgi:hypothetical protein